MRLLVWIISAWTFDVKPSISAAGGDAASGLANLTRDIAAKLAAFNQGQGGSSRRIARFKVLATPPSMDAGEITDKGYVNQREAQAHRADDVAALFATPAGAGVVVVGA
jgi:feruloyl-CoA synthase